MQNDTFEVAYNKERLEYYSFLRQSLQSDQVSYWMGNPSVQITNGIIFASLPPKDLDTANLDNQDSYMDEYKQRIMHKIENSATVFSRALLLVGIPSCKSPVQVFDRFEPYMNWIQQAKVIKTSHSKYYAMLLLFETEDNSFIFFQDLLGQQYNALDIQRILLREIKQITLQCTDGIHIETQPNLYLFRKASREEEVEKVNPLRIFLKSEQSSVRKLSSGSVSQSPTKKMHTQVSSPLTKTQEPQLQNKNEEASTCTICLESNPSTIISILCEHYFHIKCLSRWKEDTCPLCRYHQQPPLIKFCEKCNECEGLWVCLICGVRMCCGSDHNILGQGSHIYEHYLETQHRLSMDVQTKFIFDASQAAFLHKMFYQELMKNGGIENLEPQEQKKDKKKNKVSERISEFQQSISEEMQIQRVYFEENINQEVKIAKERIKDKKKKLVEVEMETKQIQKQAEQIQNSNKKGDQSVEKLQKMLKITLDVQKFWKQQAQNKGKVMKLEQDKQEEEILKLNMLIAEKRQQLKDYKANLTLQNKLKINLGGDKVQAEMYLGNEGKKKKK